MYQILQAYIYLWRHIRKGVLLRRNIASDLCGTAVGCLQFRKKSIKRQRKEELCLNVLIPFSVIVCCLVTE